ncbi:MAG TPA: 30S ribosomal protein S1 [Terriglobales bacterium]|jgi:small subunit ribosomal protein S1|nr:30S ribosomal protein S1 [Terriglobales bacterium]
MIFVDHAFEESPSRTTEPASYEQPAEEQGTSLARSSEESANDATQGGNIASDHHFENLRHTGSQKLPGAPGDKQETNMEDFATVLENFEAAQTEAMAAMENKVLTGTVLKLTSTYLVVDIGGKSEGMVPLAEITDHEGNPKFKPGDEIAVMMEHGETEEGYPKLSHVKAQRLQSMEAIEKAYDEKTTVKGRIVERVKGGLSVDLGGALAFLPGSQVDVKPAHNLDAMKGQELEVRVIKLNRKRGNIVVSRKAILDEIVAEQRSQTLEKLYEGADLTGTVKNLTDYGAFVDLGGIDGLLHITDMSWGRLTHPRDLVHVGDEIHVKVLKFDKDKQRVSLGFKQLTPDPWLDAAERYPVGAHVKGRVISVTDYGAFVELEQGIEGLIHVSEMSWSKRMKHPSKIVKVNDQVETVVLNVNPAERRISLGLKQLETNPWDTLHEKYPTGMVVEGKVRNLTEFGAFVEVEEGIDGLVHVSNMSWTKRVKHPSEVLKKGEKVKAVVLAIEPEHRRLSLGIKQLQPDAWQSFFDTHKIGDVVHGKVLRTAQFGAFVQISEGVEALCHNSEAVDEHGSSIKLEPGQEYDFKIVKMNPEEKKVGLSLRGIGEEASRADVEAYKQPVSSSSGGTTTLGEIMSLKRASNDQN